MTTKITREHLARGAYVYVRQSTSDQLMHNHESRRRQYGLAERARGLGWTDVVVIDDDLGRSGGGIARPGFERLLVAICEGRVGIVLAVEASRLARNGRDWHTLLEFCALIDCVIADEDGIYDPRSPNDRLLLGMKGTMSEMELSILRQRSMEALKQKASRGELFLTVAIGYIKVRHDRIQKDPDLRIREAMQLIFVKFSEFQSIRQVHLWLRQEKIALPAVEYGPEGRMVTWKLPVYNTIHHILTNPIYAGAYAFGRTRSRVTLEGGRKRVIKGVKKERQDWQVLLTDHHEGYISWDEFERNQQLISDNANGKGGWTRGPLRKGEALLAGLLRCGHCGRKLHVAYTGAGGNTARYHCQGAHLNHGAERCISFGNLRVDQGVSAEVIRLLQPLGVDAAIRAIEAQDIKADQTRRQVELALEQARYEAARARRQYDAVDPDNRLVAGELERRWNETLLAVRSIEERQETTTAKRAPPLSDGERARLMALGADLERAWHHPAATPETRKRILRTVLSEIIARVEGEEIILVLHWQGGDHTRLCVRKNKSGGHRWTTDASTEQMIHALARLLPDSAIASVLNRAGKRTGRGNTWTEARLRSFRTSHGIAVYRQGERAERGELTLDEATARLNVSKMTVLRLIHAGKIEARQICKGAPWVIPEHAVREIATKGRLPVSSKPVTENPDQKILQFQ
ncbi:MAG: recombinase family protein [Alphaproteobacteria bacterium]|nr:recombinase family protein [Alphaproteobacteria bacterium]